MGGQKTKTNGNKKQAGTELYQTQQKLIWCFTLELGNYMMAM